MHDTPETESTLDEFIRPGALAAESTDPDNGLPPMSERFVRDAIRRGELPAAYFSKVQYVRRGDVDTWIASKFARP